jgi:hypothetical protein
MQYCVTAVRACAPYSIVLQQCAPACRTVTTAGYGQPALLGALGGSLSTATDQTLLVPLVQERGLVERHGVRVRVLGDQARLPPEVRRAAQDVMAATAHHTRGVLNICFAYSCAQPRWPPPGPGPPSPRDDRPAMFSNLPTRRPGSWVAFPTAPYPHTTVQGSPIRRSRQSCPPRSALCSSQPCPGIGLRKQLPYPS